VVALQVREKRLSQAGAAWPADEASMPAISTVHTAPKRTPIIASSCYAIRRNLRRAAWLQIDATAATLAKSWRHSAIFSPSQGSSQLMDRTPLVLAIVAVGHTRPICTVPERR